MKVRRIPAQITTVEDKIAGNLNLTQMVLLVTPVFIFMLLYALFPPSMKLVLYKVPIVLALGSLSLILAIRIKDKIVLQWITVMLRYTLRPRYYIFTKNDAYLRTMDLLNLPKKHKKAPQTEHAKQQKKQKAVKTSLQELIRLEGLVSNPKISISIKSQKKGAFHVAFEQKQF